MLEDWLVSFLPKHGKQGDEEKADTSKSKTDAALISAQSAFDAVMQSLEESKVAVTATETNVSNADADVQRLEAIARNESGRPKVHPLDSFMAVI